LLDFSVLAVPKQKSSDVSIAERLLLNINVQIAALRGLTKMAKIIVTFKIMPEGPDVDLTKISEQAKEKIASFVGGDYDPESDLKISIVDVAFGLKALDIKAILDEEKGGTEKLEKEFKDLDGVKSVEVIDVRRIIG